jgi:hypothetical protein
MNRIRAAVDWLLHKALAHTAEEGSRQLVWAAVGGNEDELRGAYISASQVQEASDVVLGEEGRNLQNKIWVCDLVSSDTLMESDCVDLL